MKTKNQLHKMFKKYQKEKKKCVKLYPDWVDDDFNSLHNKFIWGITEEGLTNANFATNNVIYVYYNRANHCYYFSIDITGDNAMSILNTSNTALQQLLAMDDRDNISTFSIIEDAVMGGDYFQCATLTEVYIKIMILIRGISFIL